MNKEQILELIISRRDSAYSNAEEMNEKENPEAMSEYLAVGEELEAILSIIVSEELI